LLKTTEINTEGSEKRSEREVGKKIEGEKNQRDIFPTSGWGDYETERKKNPEKEKGGSLRTIY